MSLEAGVLEQHGFSGWKNSALIGLEMGIPSAAKAAMHCTRFTARLKSRALSKQDKVRRFFRNRVSGAARKLLKTQALGPQGVE
jgi:hypothetical protein